MNKQGLFISLEGSDATGKRTQHGLLADRAMKEGRVVLVDFPQYGKPSAQLAELYLKGEFGNPTLIDPRLASAVYAIDRLAAKKTIESARQAGALVLANRFSASNMAHQGAKLTSRDERLTFFDWLHNLEHTIMEIPFPDHHFVLHLPAIIARERMVRAGKAMDGLETDLAYQQRAEATFLDLADAFPEQFSVIACTDGSYEKSPAEIHEEIWLKYKDLAS